MNCADCGGALAREPRGGVLPYICRGCGALWVLESDFRHLKGTMDRFVRWLNPDLWSDIEKHEIGRGSRACPGCGRVLHEVRYADSDVVIDICPACRGIWLHKGELDKIVRYLERIIDAKTVREYLTSVGQEAVEIVAHQEHILGEIRNMGILMKLLEYRIMSRFPVLSGIASKLPPV